MIDNIKNKGGAPIFVARLLICHGSRYGNGLLLPNHGLLAVHDVDASLRDTLHTTALKVVNDLGGVVFGLYTIDAGRNVGIDVIAPCVAFVDSAL